MFERWYNRCALRLFKPALVLTHSPTLYSRWGDLGVEVCIVPNGVDTERYHPVSAERKTELRMKYGIPESSFVILHVGHIEKRRGLDVLIDVITGYKDVTVIIVASSFFKKDIDLYNRIKDAGALILEDLPSDLSEIYALSDCYLFSAIKHASIFMPLSVMEAMATNIPVISTPYEGLRTFFDEGNGIYYYSTQDELFSHTVTF
jgi:glycosyltransferase involved in cell wall biosynthesis